MIGEKGGGPRQGNTEAVKLEGEGLKVQGTRQAKAVVSGLV